MKINLRYSALFLPFVLFVIFSFSFTENPGFDNPSSEVELIQTDTIPPSKAEIKAQKAQKKLEQELKKAKYKEAKEKSKLYSTQTKKNKTQPVSSHNQQPPKEKKDKKANKKTLSNSGQPAVTTKVKPPKKEKGAGKPAKVNTNTAQSGKAAKTGKPAKTKAAKPAAVTKTPTGIVTKPEKKKKTPKTATPTSGNASFSNNPMPVPVLPDDPKNRRRGKSCDYSYNVTDPITGQSKSALESRFFFGFTEKELRQFMKGEDYLTCTGYLSQVTGVKTLNVSFVIDSPYAKDEYGSIQAGTQMIIRLVNGETITLVSEKYDSGSLSRRTGKTTYKTLFIISAKDEKLLSKSEVDIVRMVWGAGYEDYEVYELDFFIDQLSCLNEAN